MDELTEESIMLITTEHEDGYIDLHFTTLGLLEKEWLESFRYYHKCYGEKWTFISEHISSRGFSWFETKYRNITIFPITSLEETQNLISKITEDSD